MLFEACFYSSGLFVIRFSADCVKFKILPPLSPHLTCEHRVNCNEIVIFLPSHAWKSHTGHFFVLHGFHHLPHLVELGEQFIKFLNASSATIYNALFP